MWFFMYSCYIMSLVTIFCLVTAFIQSFTGLPIFKADHVTFMILTSIIYAFTETLIIFFFVGTGVSIRDYTKDHNLDDSFHKRSIGIKRKIYPPQMLNLLLMMIVFIIVGAVDTLRIPAWIYQILFAIGIIDYLRNKIIQNKCFQENTRVILDMSGIK